MEEKMEKIVACLERMISNHVFPMNNKEFENCSFLCSLLDGETPYASTKNELSLAEVLPIAFESFEMYESPALLEEVQFILIKGPIVVERKVAVPDFTHFQTSISPKEMQKSNTFSVESISIPKRFDELSPYYFGHEFHHILKDVNPHEYQYMLRYAEVIPQFYELIACRDDPDKQSLLIQNRFFLLKAMKRYLLDREKREEKNLFWNYYDSKFCQYFNSFFYSVLLYQLYLEHPKKVLEEIKKVLSHEITTYQLLEHFHLFEKDFYPEVKSGIQYFKKYSS